MTVAALAGALVTALALPGCDRGDSGASEERSTLDRVREEGTIRVGFANEAPYAYFDDDTGELTGEAPTVARAVLSRVGVDELEGVVVDFGSLIPGLKAGRFDMITAGMYVTPERCAQVVFSEPTYCIGEAFLVREGNPESLHSYEDVKNNPDVRLGVVSGTVEVGYAEAIGIPDDQLVRFPDMASAAAGVAAGRADAFAGTSLTVADLLERMGDAPLERAAPFSDPIIDGEPARGCGAFAFRKEDEALAQAVDEALASYLQSPEHRQAVGEFGFGADEVEISVTTAALCGREGSGE